LRLGLRGAQVDSSREQQERGDSHEKMSSQEDASGHAEQYPTEAVCRPTWLAHAGACGVRGAAGSATIFE
jgi:hypothetical protein